MARIGAFCFPGTGHINPMTALARRLQQRGHEVVIFGIPDTAAQVQAAGIEFSLIGENDYPQIPKIIFVTLAIELMYVVVILFFQIATPGLLLDPFGLSDKPAAYPPTRHLQALAAHLEAFLA